MKNLEITINDIKAINELRKEVWNLQEENYTAGDYCYHYNGKEALIESKESKILQNIKIAMQILGVSYGVVECMLNDLDHARFVLEDIKNNQ